jgi:hypothetical protein
LLHGDVIPDGREVGTQCFPVLEDVFHHLKEERLKENPCSGDISKQLQHNINIHTCPLASQRVSTYLLKGWETSSELLASMISWIWRKSFLLMADLAKCAGTYRKEC